MKTVASSSAFSPKKKDTIFPRLSAIKKDPIVSSIVSKLIPDTGRAGYSSYNRNQPPSEGAVRRISDETTRNITDSTNIFQLLPDTELAMQILVSSILSPKDMVNVELGYRVDSRVLDSEVSGPLLEIVRSYFEETYKIKSLLPNMLEEILFKKGSYPLLVLPESTIDDVINNDARVSLESLKMELGPDKKPVKSIGILGSPVEKRDNVNWSLESLTMRPSLVPISESTVFSSQNKKVLTGDLVVTDNLNTLKFPKVVEKLRRSRLGDLMSISGVSLESKREKKNICDEELKRNLYNHSGFQNKEYIALKTPKDLGKVNKGHPLVMKLPAESVIPVHVPSNPEEHIGYFILLDLYGNPLNRVRESDYYRDLSNTISTSNITSQVLASGSRLTGGLAGDSQNLNESEAVRIYSEIVERDLLSRLKNGVYGDTVEIARPLDVYRVMLARSLSNRGTQILYVPSELVTYMAFDYNMFGVGKSLLDDNKILASIRSMLLFSNTMAAIKNSTGRTGLRIQLDPDDPDPSSTVEYMVGQYAKNRQGGYPLGASNPLDIVNFLQNAGIDIQVSGNSAYPETTLDVEDKSTNKVLVDNELSDEIKRNYFMSLGLSPETVDLSSDVEFATSVVTSNLLLAKRVMLYQDKLTYFLKDFIYKYTTNSSSLVDLLLESLEANKSNLTGENKTAEITSVLDLFLNSIEVHLPRPDSAKLENQITAFEQYSAALEAAIDAYFGDDSFMLEAFDDIEGDVSTIRAAVIAYFKREWLRNNNVLPEVMDLVITNDKGKPELDLLEIHGNHMELIGQSITGLILKLRKDREKRDAKLEEQEEEDNLDTEEPSGAVDTETADEEEGFDNEEEATDETVDEETDVESKEEDVTDTSEEDTEDDDL